MAWTVFNGAKNRILSGGLTWSSDTVRVMLLTSSYTPNIDTQAFVADIVANEVAGGGYARQSLAGKAVTTDTTNDRAGASATNPTFTSLTATFRYAVLFRLVTNDADSWLIAYEDLGAQSVTAADFTIDFDGATSSDVLRLT